MALSEFQTKRFPWRSRNTTHLIMEFDGVVEASDFDKIAQKVAQNLGVNSGSPEHDKITSAIGI